MELGPNAGQENWASEGPLGNPRPGRYKILSATPIPVYNRSGETAEEVGAIGAGLFIYVISSQDGWLGVLSPTGKVGYVRREHLFPRAVSHVSPEAE